MSKDALPCIACGVFLRNVYDNAANQPSGGTAFTTEGHYGSTVFDPMNGEHIEINVCDDCLVQAGQRGAVYAGRSRRPVVVEGIHVGWEAIDRPLVEWHKGLSGYDDVCALDESDIRERLPETIHLHHSVTEIRAMIEALEDSTS